MGRRQRLHLRERPLTGGLPRAIHIHYHPLLSCSVEHATGGRKRFAGEQILLKKRAQGFHSALVKGGKKTGKGRAMG